MNKSIVVIIAAGILIIVLIVLYIILSIREYKLDGKLKIVRVNNKYKVYCYSRLFKGFWFLVKDDDGNKIFDTYEDAMKVLKNYRKEHPLEENYKEEEVYREK